MGSWLYIDENPPIVFYNNQNNLSLIGDYRVFPLLLDFKDIRNDGVIGGQSQENSNTAVEIKNTDGELTEVIGMDPPLGKKAILYQNDTILFEGIIETIKLGSTSVIEIEA